MEKIVRALFDRHAELFRKALAGDADSEAEAALFAAEFIAASPAGVQAGRNDAGLVQAMKQSFDHYRETGTKEMSIRGTEIIPIDDLHCMARVSWHSVYARKDRDDAVIDFDVHYFVQVLDGEPKIFGWVSGDEGKALKDAGVT